jgi:hypothetical protein
MGTLVRFGLKDTLEPLKKPTRVAQSCDIQYMLDAYVSPAELNRIRLTHQAGMGRIPP